MSHLPKPELAAIVHADVVGSTRLIKRDHQLALALIQSTFARLAAVLEQHSGTVCEIRGDAVVARFSRASDAVLSACLFQDTEQKEYDNTSAQQQMRVQLRIGISLGEVIQTDTVLSGAGVVMAQRLEQLAIPGGLVVQGSIADMLNDQDSVVFNAIGEHDLKGFDHPVIAFAAQLRTQNTTGTHLIESKQKTVWSLSDYAGVIPAKLTDRSLIIGLIAIMLILIGVISAVYLARNSTQHLDNTPPTSLVDERPSIAVLPFTRLGNQSIDTYLTDGITEDVITDLSKLSGLLVISRDSSFSFENSTMELPEIATALGARYILNGNVQHSNNRIRINTRLIDSNSNTHVWAERYEFETENIFDSQDKISSDIIDALALRITPEEKRFINLKPTENLQAYEYFQKGQSLLHTSDMLSSREYFLKAIELDPTFARAYAALSISHAASTTQTLSSNNQSDISEAFELATKAVAIDSDSAEANFALSLAFLYRAQHEQSLKALKKTLKLNPNSSDAYLVIGWNHLLLGNHEIAIANLSNAFRLRPTGGGLVHTYLGVAYCLAGRLDEAESILAIALEFNPELVAPRIFQAVTQFRLGQLNDAAWEKDEIMVLYPDFTISNWPWISLFSDTESPDLVSLLDDMREIGFPE